METEINTNNNFYQVVTLELVDGRKIQYTGRYALKETDRVVGVSCTPAHLLPHGMIWERMIDAEKSNES